MTLKLWDAQTGAELATLAGHAGEVRACAFSPDGRRIVSASADNTLKLWDARQEPNWPPLRATRMGDGCAFSPDGGRIVSASRDHTLKLWDAETGAELATLAGHEKGVTRAPSPPMAAASFRLPRITP